jgi:hypothetical protein
MSRSRTIHHGPTIILAVLVASATVACTTTTAAPAGDRPAATTGTAQAVARSASKPKVSGLIANARAAQRQHDWRLLRRFQTSLIEVVGLPAISEARASYSRAVADLAAATAAGDSRARAGFRAELRALCGPDGLVAAFESCDADVVVWSN